MHVANKAVALALHAGIRGLRPACDGLRLRSGSSTQGFHQTLHHAMSRDGEAIHHHPAGGAPRYPSSRAAAAAHAATPSAAHHERAAPFCPRKRRPITGPRSTSWLDLLEYARLVLTDIGAELFSSRHIRCYRALSYFGRAYTGGILCHAYHVAYVSSPCLESRYWWR